ncbi:MAG TPA: hypothetical protein VIV35_05445 [Chitinophagaceae bacterium]
MSCEENYSLTAFFHTHQNPVEAGLVKIAEDWAYSSYRDYAGIRTGTLCNKERAFQLLGLSDINFKTEIAKKIDEEKIKKFFSAMRVKRSARCQTLLLPAPHNKIRLR